MICDNDGALDIDSGRGKHSSGTTSLELELGVSAIRQRTASVSHDWAFGNARQETEEQLKHACAVCSVVCPTGQYGYACDD